MVRNRNASLLYIDNPVGAGFSYTGSDAGYPRFVNESSDDLFIALQQFFTIWHEYVDRSGQELVLAPNRSCSHARKRVVCRDFYVFGESYGGKYIPALSHRILKAKRDPDTFGGPVEINLVGLGIGNGWMSPFDQVLHSCSTTPRSFPHGEEFFRASTPATSFTTVSSTERSTCTSWPWKKRFFRKYDLNKVWP